VSGGTTSAPCPNRSFDRLSLALKEVIDARVWSGIHFRPADVQGGVLCEKVAHYVQTRYFLTTHRMEGVADGLAADAASLPRSCDVTGGLSRI
jgi:hypothetical protein